MPRLVSPLGTSFLVNLQPWLGTISAPAGLVLTLSTLALLNPSGRVRLIGRALGQESLAQVPRPTHSARRALRYLTVVLALIFLLSALLNLGVQVPLGFDELSFQSPSSSIATFEVVIALVLLGAAASSNLYLYGGAYLFAIVGISAGLLSGDVQGLARTLHETMVPFVVVGWLLVILEANVAYRSRGQSGSVATHQQVITALQFFVGALVTPGGAAFVRGGTYPIGTTLGVVHLFVGLAGLLGGYVIMSKKPWSRSFLIGINGVTIAYSAFAESLVEAYAYLPPGINDSLIGTVIAIVVSAVIIYMLTRRS